MPPLCAGCGTELRTNYELCMLYPHPLTGFTIASRRLSHRSCHHQRRRLPPPPECRHCPRLEASKLHLSWEENGIVSLAMLWADSGSSQTDLTTTESTRRWRLRTDGKSGLHEKITSGARKTFLRPIEEAYDESHVR